MRDKNISGEQEGRKEGRKERNLTVPAYNSGMYYYYWVSSTVISLSVNDVVSSNV